jgi:hypothetical protein
VPHRPTSALSASPSSGGTHLLSSAPLWGVEPTTFFQSSEVPECLASRTAEWWRAAWERTGLVNLRAVDHMPAAWALWLRQERAIQAAVPNRWPPDVPKLEADGGEYLTLIRLVADRREIQLR